MDGVVDEAAVDSLGVALGVSLCMTLGSLLGVSLEAELGFALGCLDGAALCGVG